MLFENQRTLFGYLRTMPLQAVHFCIVIMTNTNEQNIASENRITVLLAEESKLVREAWSLVMKKDPRFQITAGCGTAESALLQAKNSHPSVFVFEVKPPGLSGMEMLPLVRKYSPGSRILVISVYTFQNIARELMEAGAAGFVTKTSSASEMLQAIVKIEQGETYVCREIKNHHRDRFHDDEDAAVRLSRLTLREMEIVVGLRNGMKAPQIAEELKLSGLTVENHRIAILKKLRLNDASELVDFISEHQLQNQVF